MSARSQMRKLFGLHLPKTSRASRQRSRRQEHAVRMLLEPLQERVMLSATIVSVPGGATGVASTTAWMGPLPDGIPLTDISLPGTYESASGPSLQDALSGSGSENQVSALNATTIGVIATHATAAVATVAATIAGGTNQTLNGVATAADTAALAADTAAGITQTSTGALLTKSLASDVTSLTAAINNIVQAGLSSATATAATTTIPAIPAGAANAADVTAAAADGPAATADTVGGHRGLPQRQAPPTRRRGPRMDRRPKRIRRRGASADTAGRAPPMGRQAVCRWGGNRCQ